MDLPTGEEGLTEYAVQIREVLNTLGALPAGRMLQRIHAYQSSFLVEMIFILENRRCVRVPNVVLRDALYRHFFNLPR